VKIGVSCQKPQPLRQLGQQPAGDRLDERHFQVFLHRHDIDDTPGAEAEQINTLGYPWCRYYFGAREFARGGR